MVSRLGMCLVSIGALCLISLGPQPMPACCPAPPSGMPVINADQAVIILWDAANKMQHFIRRASFKSEANDFGILVPSPSQPELAESGNEAFPFLYDLTAPKVIIEERSEGMSCGCGGDKKGKATTKLETKFEMKPAVKILEEKEVAGFKASVLETKSATALVGWLKENGYAFSAEVEAWAKPYVENGWKITALKVIKETHSTEKKNVTAGALRMSFKTDRPLFPYREPDFKEAVKTLGARDRLLRIYFVGEARYRGEMTKDVNWSGRARWSDKLSGASRDEFAWPLEVAEGDWAQHVLADGIRG